MKTTNLPADKRTFGKELKEFLPCRRLINATYGTVTEFLHAILSVPFLFGRFGIFVGALFRIDCMSGRYN